MTGHTSLCRRHRSNKSLWRDSRGATAVEYGLIVALIVIVMIVALRQVANVTTTMWQDVNSKVTNAS
jgi:pilus assembly protein Flp/PilA